MLIKKEYDYKKSLAENLNEVKENNMQMQSK